MLNKDLEIIKKKYGENMMKLCRELFPSILEEEGVLSKIILSNFYPNHNLYDDIIDNKLENNFKNYIYNMIDVSKKQEKINKTPEELFEEKGYILKECLTKDEIREYKKYYKKEEELCTFRGNRLNSCRVFFAVKKDVLDIKREDFKEPKRQDLYGTSVISIQFTKDGTNTLSIKNRYNHRVVNPDATFSNNLDNIKEGLTYAFEKYYGIIQKYKSNNFEIPNYVRANDGKLYKYNYEINNIYYCPNNILIENFRPRQLEKEKYVLMDYYLLDLVNKTLKRYGRSKDSFIDSLSLVDKIEVINNHDKKTVKLLHKNKNETIIVLDKYNRIIGLASNDIEKIEDDFLFHNRVLKCIELPNLEKVGMNFLDYNKDLTEISFPSLKEVDSRFISYNSNISKLNLPNLTKTGSCFLESNEKLEELNLPSLRYTGNDFLRKNRIINKVYMPNLFMVGNDFLACNKTLKELSLPLLEYADESFLCYNNGIRKLELPVLKEAGKFFLMGNGNLLKLNLPALKEIKDYFLAYNSKVILNMPNLRIISDKQSSHIKFMIYCNKMCNYARKTSKIRKLVKK